MVSVQAQIAVLPPGGDRLEIQSVSIPAPAPWEVVVEQRATGVCHSQLDHIAAADPKKPLLLGHEAAGRVVAVGDRVDYVAPGDDVLITWLPRSTTRVPTPAKIPLPSGRKAGTRNVFTWGSHTLVDEHFLVKIPKGLPADLVSIIGCAVMTGAGAVINCAQPKPGESVAVWGAGGVGLSAIAAAANLGAGLVIAVDIDDAKLALARRFGATHVFNASESDPVEEIKKLVGADGPAPGVDYSVDCTGLLKNFDKSLDSVRTGVRGGGGGGVMILVGAIRDAVNLGGMTLINGQKSLVGTLGGNSVPERDFATFIDWFERGQLDLGQLVTDRYPLEEVNQAVDDLRSGRIRGRAVIEL